MQQSELMLSVLANRSRLEFNMAGAPKLVTFLNPYSYVISRNSSQKLKRFDLIFSDGILLVAALRLIGVKTRRMSFDMTSLAPIVFDICRNRQLSIALVGGEPGIAEKAAEYFQKEGGGLDICCLRSGFFSSTEQREEFISHLRDVKPDVVIVGMGTPLQEDFLLDLFDAGWRGWGFTCGGFFHQTASKGVRYYPVWADRLHLRWLYRIFDEPYLLRRYLTFYPKFSFLFFLDGLRCWFGRK